MEEIDLKELLQMFLEKKFLIIFVIILFAILGAVYTTKFVVPLYEASTSLILVQTSPNESNNSQNSNSTSITATDLALNSKLVDDYREIAKSKYVANKVKENLNLNIETEQLRKNISVSSVSDTEVIKITIIDEDPKTAVLIADEVAQVFMSKVEEIYKVNNVHVLDSAEEQIEPSNINLPKNIIMFAFIGAIVVFGYVLLVNLLDTTVKSDVDIEKNLDLPVLAAITLSEEKNTNQKKFKKGEMSK